MTRPFSRRRGGRLATALLALLTLLVARVVPLLAAAGPRGGCCGGRCHASCTCCPGKTSPGCAIRSDCSPDEPGTPAGFPQVTPAVLVTTRALAALPAGGRIAEPAHNQPPIEPPDPPDPPPRAHA